MNAEGDLIKALEKTAPTVQGSYSALVSNYLPDSTLLARMADAGVDTFFRGACDLVVPTEGGWKVGTAPTVITPSEIACFNLSNGGNIKSDLNVVHTQFFGQPQTIDFLVETLSGTAHTLPVLDPSLHLPSRGLRAAGPTEPETARTLPPKPESAAPEVQQVMTPSGLLLRRAAVPTEGLEADEVFHLFIMSPDEPNPLQQGEQKPNTRTSMSRKQTAKPKSSVALLLATFRNAHVVDRVVLPREDLDSIRRFNDDIRDYINGKPGAPNLPGREVLKEVGMDLFNAMFPPGVRWLYDVARSEVLTRGHRLSIVMTSMINSVADKPWEFAYDLSRQTFLAPEDVNFTRNVLTSVPSDVESKPHGPMHILVVVAQPVGLGLLSAKEEETMVLRGFRHLMDAKMADVQVLRNATADLLHQTLELSEYDVIHFIGHGEYNEHEQEGYLIFESVDGRAQPVSAESLRQILCHRNLRLVFLNACETGMVGRSNAHFDFNRGLAPKLVSGGIPAVVANQYKVLDLSATEFARRFYWSLAQGKSVGDAAREARVAVNYSIAGECIDWAVPVVYARNPCHSLFRPIHAAPAPQEVPAGAPERRAAATEKKRIGLWDVNHVLPSLEKVAEKLSNAQSMYSFEVIDITAPLGTWRLIQDKNQATQQGVIHGDEVCDKLRGQVNGLGLSRLFCITTFAVADTFGKKYIKDLAMWNNDPQQKITIISGAGNLFQEQSKNPDYPVARFISNCIANALCEENEHQKAPTNCPNFFREKHRTMQERLEYTTGHQHLCGACQRKLGNKALSDVVQQILDEF